MAELIEGGKIINTHGIKGEVKIDAWCDEPSFLLSVKKYYLADGKVLNAESSRVHKEKLLVKFKEICSINEAEPYMNKIVYFDKNDIDLDEGVFYVQDLIGLEVEDVDSGEVYGVITDVLPTGANDVYEVERENGTKAYIPAIKDVVCGVDLEGGAMLIKPLKGLFDI